MGRDLIVSLTFSEETWSHQIQRAEGGFTYSSFLPCFHVVVLFFKINLRFMVLMTSLVKG
jgi:hypothetical protein